jgi:hypothetical protein
MPAKLVEQHAAQGRGCGGGEHDTKTENAGGAP